MFRPSDVRRVQAAFDDALPAPYEAELELLDYRRTLKVRIADPDDASRTVGMVMWWYDPTRPKSLQPSKEELAQIVAAKAKVCEDYPAWKAANDAEHAARVARQEANAAARLADQEAAAEAQAEE